MAAASVGGQPSPSPAEAAILALDAACELLLPGLEGGHFGGEAGREARCYVAALVATRDFLKRRMDAASPYPKPPWFCIECGRPVESAAGFTETREGVRHLECATGCPPEDDDEIAGLAALGG